MTAAKYRHRIEVQKNDPVRNTDGQWIDNWVTDYYLWAQKDPRGGDEYFEAKSTNAVRTVMWKTRYNKDLEKNGEGKRIVHDGLSYDIKTAFDVKGLHKEIEIVSEAIL